VSAPYREAISFDVAAGPRASAELRRAARPGLVGRDVFIAIAVVAVAIILWSDAWRDYTAWSPIAVLLFVAWAAHKQTRLVETAQLALDRKTRGSIDDDGIRIESEGGGWARWSWDRVTFARRTSSALAIFTDTDVAIIVLAEQTPNLDRIAEIARARARAPWRAPSRWMLAILVAYVLLACVAVAARPLGTPHDRIDDALQRHVAPSPSDLDALGHGDLCARVDLDALLASHHRMDLAPFRSEVSAAEMIVAHDLHRCAPGELTLRGRVLVDDEWAYYVYALRGGGWAVSGPWEVPGSEAWTHVEEGELDVDAAFDAAIGMHQRWFGHPPMWSPTFDVSPFDDDDE
jgi:hypothetical protein